MTAALSSQNMQRVTYLGQPRGGAPSSRAKFLVKTSEKLCLVPGWQVLQKRKTEGQTQKRENFYPLVRSRLIAWLGKKTHMTEDPWKLTLFKFGQWPSLYSTSKFKRLSEWASHIKARMFFSNVHVSPFVWPGGGESPNCTSFLSSRSTHSIIANLQR